MKFSAVRTREQAWSVVPSSWPAVTYGTGSPTTSAPRADSRASLACPAALLKVSFLLLTHLWHFSAKNECVFQLM